MSFPPIVERELRLAARQRGLFRLRGLVALLTSAVVGVLVLASYATSSNQMGGTVFSWMLGIAYVYCLFEGLRGADAISRETREGTLGLLFLTNLRAYDVIFGKLASVSIRSFQGFFAFLPVLAVTLILGGVTPGEFWRAALTLCCTLFLAL